MFLTQLIHALMQENRVIFEHQHLVQHALDIPDQMGGEHDGRVFVVIAQNGVQNVIPRSRIDAAQRLIEQVQPRGARHHQAELHFFPHALAHRADALAVVELQIQQHVARLCAVEIREEIRVHPHRVAHAQA